MSKLSPVRDTRGNHVGYLFECPGCKIAHQISHEEWKFNGDVDKPTFSPSYLCWWREGDENKRCHSYITDGKIRFLGDCTHELKNQTVELPEFDWENIVEVCCEETILS